LTGEVDVHEFANTAESIAQPEEVGFSPEALQSFNHIVDLLKRRQVPKKKLRELMIAISANEDNSGDEGEEAYDETFDMEKEVAEVLRAVKILRNSMLNESKKGLKVGVTIGEAKDVLSMSNSMINTLMKSHEKIVNMARYRAVEQATVDILRDLDGDEKFITDLENFQAEGKKGEGPLIKSFMAALESRLDQ